MLRLRTFGGAAAQDPATGTEVTLQRRALALLAVLAASLDVGVSREKLLLYFWPDSDEERARNALRQVLHSIRKALGDMEPLLGTTDLRLNSAVIGSDVADFELALSQGDFEKAAATYRGAFLDGFHLTQAPEFEYWMDRQRAEYASRAASAMERVAREAADRGQADVAVTWWRRLAALEPLNSRLALELMKALAAAGDPASALQHARVHETMLREELGGTPDPAIAGLVEQLRTSKVPQRAPPPASEPAPSPLPATSGDTPEGIGLRDRLQAVLEGRYAVERELQPREGTTRVFLARDLKHDRPVTIKVLHPGLASALDTGRFHREIGLIARLQHPNIVALLDSGEAKAHVWYVSPFLPGETLRERLVREGRLPVETAREILRGVGSALDYAHGEGVIHRDIRPENVLLAGGQALISNLGVARAVNAAAGPQLTASGVLVGSPAYMSPEEAAGRPLDPRSDLYSLGCVLYEMIAGQPVHTGPTAQAILGHRLARQATGAIPSTSPLPAGLVSVIEKALALAPAERYFSAAALLHAVEQAASGPATEPPPSAASTGDSSRMGRVALAVALAALAVALLAGLFFLAR